MIDKKYFTGQVVGLVLVSFVLVSSAIWLSSCSPTSSVPSADPQVIWIPPWTPVDQGVAKTGGITLAWHDLILNDRYTAVVYSLSSEDKTASGKPMEPLRAALRVNDSTTLAPVTDVPVGSWEGIDMRVAVFGPRPADSDFLELELIGVQGGQQLVEGAWQVRLLEIDAANDVLAKGYQQPYPGILELNGAVVRTLAGGWLSDGLAGDTPEETQLQNPGTPTPVPVTHDFSDVATVQFVNAARGMEQDWMFGFSADGQVTIDSRLGSITASGMKLLQAGTPAPAPGDDDRMLQWQSVTLSEAALRSGMSIRTRPEATDGPLLEAVRFAQLSTPGRSVVHLHYADGVDIMQWPAQGDGEPAIPGGQSLGMIKSEAVDLDGIAASGFAAGSAVDDRTGQTISYPGQLSWEADGIHYIIYADQALEGLIAIAQSLQPVARD